MTTASTGDLKNLLVQLYAELRSAKFKGHIEPQELSTGIPTVFLQITHFILLQAFPHFTADIVHRGYDLRAKRDKRFMETVYRLLRDEFTYKPSISRDQFFSYGFGARKILFLIDLFSLVKSRVLDLERRRRLAGGATNIASSVTSRPKSQLRRPISTTTPISDTLLSPPSPSPEPPLPTSQANDPSLADISLTIPIPASPSSAPTPSSPPLCPTSAPPLSSSCHSHPPFYPHLSLHPDQNGKANSINHSAHTLDKPGASVACAAEDDLSTHGMTASPSIPANSINPPAKREVEIQRVLAYVTSSIARLSATLKGMQIRLEQLERVQDEALANVQRGEDERVSLREQNQILRNDNNRLVADLTDLRATIATLKSPALLDTSPSSTPRTTIFRPVISPLITMKSQAPPPHTSSTQSPVTTTAPLQSSLGHSCTSSPTNSTPSVLVTSSYSSSVPMDSTLKAQMEEADQLRVAINQRLAATQALLAHRNRSTA